jgi:hypothetical protein
MPFEFVANIESFPVAMIGLAIVAFVVAMAFERSLAKRRRQAWWNRNRWRWARRRYGNNVEYGSWIPQPPPAEPKRPDAADQLRIVMGADFASQPLLNQGEARVFRELDRFVLGFNPTWQVMAQVSLGEILRCADAEAYSCINSKRVDLLIVDENCQPRHAIEYQGWAHHQGTAAARDAVKKEALRRAGIGYHEVVAGQMTPSELRRLVERLVDKPPG